MPTWHAPNSQQMLQMCFCFISFHILSGLTELAPSPCFELHIYQLNSWTSIGTNSFKGTFLSVGSLVSPMWGPKCQSDPWFFSFSHTPHLIHRKSCLFSSLCPESSYFLPPPSSHHPNHPHFSLGGCNNLLPVCHASSLACFSPFLVQLAEQSY